MSWPEMTAYQEAIQHPPSCFTDPELRSGRPVLDRLGLPRPISGNFACVYQLECDSRKVAVRCFLSHYPDLEKRYAVIGQHLRRAGLPCMVDFEFLSQGIRLRGQVYPILKMEWVEGQPLNTYLENNLAKPAAIWDVAQRFLATTADLRRWQIAHGDLQHGNILISNGQLRLVDYDGMYVPGLSGMSSAELGHRNYQHPRRTGKDFGPDLDNFSVWAIYLSLVAFCAGPRLWREADAGDDRLLFRQEDFEHPDGSGVFRTLSEIQDNEFQRLLSFFRTCLSADLARIPPLDGMHILRHMPAPALVHPGWLADHMPASVPAPAPIPAAPATSAWVLDHLERPAPVLLGSTPVVERVLVALLVQLAILLSVLAYENVGMAAALGAAPAALIGGAALLLPALAVRYWRLPPVKAKRSRQAVLRGLVECRRRSQAELDRLVDRRRDLDQLEAEEFSTLQRRLSETDQAEAEEISATFAGYQAGFIHNQLKRNALGQAHLPGIGRELRRRLAAAGIRTAADVTGRVRETAGIGPARAAVLLEWRQQLEASVRPGQRQSLPVLQESAIRSRYLAERQSLRRRAAEAQAGFQTQRSDLEAREEEKQRVLAGASAATARIQRELDGYRHITFVTYLARIVFLS